MSNQEKEGLKITADNVLLAWAVSLVIILAVLPLSPVLDNGFIWDDHELIEKNAALDRPGDDFFRMVHYGPRPTPYYRPLMAFFHASLRAVWGLKPWGFHLASLLLHASVSGLLLLVLWRVTSPVAAMVAAGLFAVHPVHVEAVAFASAGPNDLLACLFFLPAVLFILPKEKGSPAGEPSRLGIAVSSALIFTAMLAKETAVVFPVVMALTAWRSLSGPVDSAKLNKRLLLPWGAALLLYGLLRSFAAWRTEYFPRGEMITAQASQYPTFILEVVRLLFWPRPLLPYYEIGPATWPVVFVSLFLLGGLAYASFRLGRARGWDPGYCFGAAALVLTLLPALPFLPRAGSLLAERFLYLPSVGLAVLIGCALDTCALNRPRLARRLVLGALAAVIALWSAWSFAAALDWKNDLILYTRGIQRSPDNAVLYLLRGSLHLAEKRPAEAERDILKYLSYIPGDLRAQVTLGEIYRVAGRNAEARAILNGVIAKDPGNAKARFSLGSLEMDHGDRSLALRELAETIRLDPALQEAYVNLGVLHYEAGDIAQAERYWLKGLDLYDKNPLLLNNLGVIAKKSGRLDQAERYFQRALDADPAYQEARDNLASLRAGTGTP